MSTEGISLLKLAGFTTTVAVIEYVWISPDMITLLAMLMILDVVTWITKRLALGKRDITSRKLWVGMVSKVFILAMLLLLAWAFKITTLGNEMAIAIVIGGFVFAEMYSSIQNIYIMLSKKEVTEYDAFTIIIGWLLAFVRNRIEKTLDILNKQ